MALDCKPSMSDGSDDFSRPTSSQVKPLSTHTSIFGDQIPEDCLASSPMSIASTPLLEKEKKGAGEEEAAKSSPQATFESKGDPTAQSQSQAQTSPIRSLFKEYVHVDVGPYKVRFGVHKGLISKYSKYFNAAFNGSFSEAVNGVVVLPKESSRNFEIMHTWLYTNELTQTVGGKDAACGPDQLADAFIFGDKYDMPLLRNKAIDVIASNYSSPVVVVGCIAHAYANTTAGSPLRRLLAAMFTAKPTLWIWVAGKATETFLECPEFLFDVAMELAKSGNNAQTKGMNLNDAPFKKDLCAFHEHAEGEKDCSGTIVSLPGKPHTGSGAVDISETAIQDGNLEVGKPPKPSFHRWRRSGRGASTGR
ncbi:hypothetical protein HO173_011496 [Letharia columbiana]|uniref:BTB domain-containing protein n=1 Tax=Letharia columbiana TaxID=112416 RepID=A0A8H6FJG2_9LECA|nr:uncharacterized protein HO173_011496 [Letharia columbiana]KAF6229641.1 hypothetical protein HO173_011496 [Letharia columbiana]